MTAPHVAGNQITNDGVEKFFLAVEDHMLDSSEFGSASGEIARGAIVDEDALIAALRSGKLAAAGLDVFKNEPHIRPEFRELENVVLLPHIGSATKETREAMGFRALDNLDAFFAGRKPRDRVA